MGRQGLMTRAGNRCAGAVKLCVMALLTTCVSLAALVGGAAASCDTAGRTDASSAVKRSSSEDDYTRQMEQLKTELLQALPAIPPQARARYLESLAQRAKAEAELKAAQARCEQVAKAQGLVDHARGKWIGGADKGIAEAKAKLAQAQTPVEKQTAEQELAKWEQNRLDGEAALQERLAALAEAQREQPQHEQAVKVAEAALADARAQTAQAIEGLGLQAFLASDQLDRKLAKYVVLYEATPRGLAEFAKQSSRNQDLLEKMFADEGLLVQMVLADGAQKGKYGPAMAIFEAIQDASPKAREGVFQRLALAIALEHAEPIARRNAVADTAAPAFVDPVQRYLHYERAFLAGELDPAFDQLTVWDLRMVVYGEEPDELLAWGREMLKNYRPDHIATPDYRWRYVGAVRTDVKYGSQDCKYDQDELQFFQNILMNGGVCGRRAFFGRFILRAFGIPTTARPQKGHAALVHWTPDGWVVCLGANWGNGWTKTVYDKDLDFLATTQARALGADYLRVKRAHWIGDLLGEKRVYGELSGQPEFWNSIALLTQRQLIEAAQVKALAAVGEDIAEANESKEKETFAPVIITEEDRQISVDAAGVLTIPAVATSKPLQSTGKILFMNSVLGGKQLHYNRNGGPEDFEYEVVIPEAGKYLLGARVVTPSWRQSLQVRVNAAADPQDILLPFTVGEWEATQPIVVDLQAGKNVLRFSREGATAGITIKDFTLTPAPGE